MYSEPTGGPTQGGPGSVGEPGRPILLVGPPEETAPVATAFEAEGYPCREYGTLADFLEELFKLAPQAVVFWDHQDGPEIETALAVLRHHAGARRCPVICARRPGTEQDSVCSKVNAVVERPVDPTALRELFRECSEGDAKTEKVPRILVVDDDQNILLLGSHIVSGLGMFPVAALDGREAIEKCRRLRPDLILLDINMPEMDGFEVIQSLKSDASLSMIPIIVFSARRTDEDKVHALKLGADDYVTKPFSIGELGARIDRLLDRTRTGVSASSTTGLPGSVSMEQALVERIDRQEPFAVIYVDADHFKAFNDRYGFTRGDSVIRQIADLLLQTARDVGSSGDFVGHIGGDDFVAITDPEHAVPIADALIDRFDGIIPHYYDREDRERGIIETEDRKGRKDTFPLMSISIAIVTNETRTFRHPGEVADVAAQLKHYAKRQTGSVWVKDQRADDDD